MSTHVGDIFFDAKINRKEYDKGLASLGRDATRTTARIGRKLALGLGAIGFGAFIKKATSAGASLNAMGTIIDASLPNMTKKVDQFAQSAGNAFGLSETQAKGFVGKYASMASAMGYTEEQAYKMSTALTGLAGDVASYYHISADDAYLKLGAVFTGETEALKQLGVVMTQNALDAFAMQRGYGAVTSQMSELEKTTLRYNFVLDRLKLASGDFSKYANTWSGSIATIKLNWSNFMATVGQGIINILLPLLQLIARISQALTALGSRFVAWTKRVRGIKESVSSAFGKKTQKDLKTANTGIGNVGKGLGGAGKSAKGAKKAVQALKRELLGFDKITKLAGENGTSSGAGTSGGGGVGGGGIGDIGDIGLDSGFTGSAQSYVDGVIEQLRKAWETANFYPIGKAIAEWMNKGMASIDWDSIRETCFNIAKSLGTFINGFVENFDWGLLAKSISNGIKTAVDTMSTFIEAINWEAVGKAIVDFICGIDWIGLFMSGMRLLHAIRDALQNVLKGAFEQACEKVADLVKIVRDAIAKAFGKLGEFTADIKLGLQDKFSSAWDKVKKTWEGVKSKTAELTTKLANKFSSAWDKVKKTWSNVKSKTATATMQISDKFSSVWKKIKDKWNGIKSKSATISLKFKDALKAKWNSLANSINNARAKAPKAIQKILPKMPLLAQGGFVKANTPQLAIIGDNKREGEIVAPESKLRAMAQEVAGSSNQQVVALLTAILGAVNGIDTDIYLDGESIKNNVVRRMNQHTKATGRLELII